MGSGWRLLWPTPLAADKALDCVRGVMPSTLNDVGWLTSTVFHCTQMKQPAGSGNGCVGVAVSPAMSG